MSTQLSRGSAKNAMAGLAASFSFLFFVSSFNDFISKLKEKRNIKSSKTRPGSSSKLFPILKFIFTKSCSPREVSTFFGLALCLLLRTLGSVWVSRHWGKIVAAFVRRKFSLLHALITKLAVATISLSVLNALLKYYISLLKEQLREKITLFCHEKYMTKRLTFYKANFITDESSEVFKMENLDHRITSDVEKFSELFATVLSQSLKPIVDFVVYSVELSRVQGLTTPLVLYSWFAFASALSTFTMPPFQSLVAKEQQLEGRFIQAHGEVITNAEQIAFLGGEDPELNILNKRFQELNSHNLHSISLYFKSEVLRQYLNKYFVTVIGLLLAVRPLKIGRPGFLPHELNESGVSQYFVTVWKNMEAMSTSIQDLFELSNRIGRLSGLATRVSELMEKLECTPKEKILTKHIGLARATGSSSQFISGKDLRFDGVSVYKPDGTLLVQNLNFQVKRGDRVLVTGPNGCGKSSLFRVIRKLWPLVKGKITLPSEDSLYFLTQVNFVPLGTLRDLVTYPKVGCGKEVDERVLQVLDWAECSPAIVKNGKAQLEFTVNGAKIRPRLDDVRDWGKDLSPGQKQKIAFARLFFHKPQFVVLDECTNGISPDVEGKLYDRCTALEMGIFSISHKIELKEFHDYELHYHGDAEGGYDFLPCSETRGRYLG
eukprot:augustus_masked-scaffold_8-processed-gene-4.46-mRNA-1 protein AED:0.01 eAED:0.01 QI:0/-1/0/1/-1/1/1/0/659